MPTATAMRILAAAEEQFAAKGLAGARTDEIAAAARANKAMLYYYFGDKRRLHRTVLENLFQQLRSGISSEPGAAESPRERLRAITVAYFDFLAAHPNYPRLMQREAMAATKNVDWIVREYLRPLHAQLSRAIAEGIEARELRRVDPKQAAITILGMVTSYFAAAPILSRIAGRDLLSAEAIRGRKDALLDFMEHGLLAGNKGCR
ncbi:MAG TPA: CerR family C-terminal domain-containing protein [Candidatus Acidoferrales bacterium]|nr:CerR family C-terminal domain-containing protein [Candidatus Acidoferrales bacterium]